MEDCVTEAKSRLKDNLIIVATVINILLASVSILGAMRWISEVDSSMKVLQEGQRVNAELIRDLKKWQVEISERIGIHEAFDNGRFSKLKDGKNIP